MHKERREREYNNKNIYTNALRMVDKDPNERAYVSNLLIELLLLCIEIVTITSQLEGTHLYLFHIQYININLIAIKLIQTT